MLAPLLATKLYIPRRQPLSQQTTLVPRPHLWKKLEAGLVAKLTLIAAPAGFGKSTLITDWIAETGATSFITGTSDSGKTSSKSKRRPAFCWLSLEESDNDPVRFWRYFIAALHSQNPELSADTPALLESPEIPPLETILTILLNDLNAWTPGIAPGIVLVLEDYHAISLPEIHTTLAFLLEHLPPTLHLVITTRADPPLPLARLRARGQLSEIRTNDLRFTAAETDMFLTDRMGLQLSPDEVQLLAARTEGWIAGLQLAALSMHGQNDKAGFLRSFSGGHRYVLNYLIEEVLNQQSNAIQEFLLRTSILARLCGPLCDAVMETDATASVPPNNGQAMLEQLEQANLFLVPLDDLGEWYRYHQLFAEVLQHRLRQRLPALVTTLHHRASLWYAQRDHLSDGIRHALLATDFTYAAALIERAWPTLWNQGEVATLFNWMQALQSDTVPDEALWGRPGLYFSYAWGLALTGQIKAAEECLRQVEATLQRTGSDASSAILLGRAAALGAMLAARSGEPAKAVALAQQALTLIPLDAEPLGDAYYALGLARQQQGALTEALQAYKAATQLGTAANNKILTVAARYHEARILMVQGYLQNAATTYQHVLKVAARASKQLPVVGLAHVGYGEILYQWNKLDAAIRHVDTGLALSPRGDQTYTDGPLHRFRILARIRQAVGDEKGTLAAVGLAQETAERTGVALDVERAAALAALIHLRLGDLAIAERWAELYARVQTDEERFSYLHEFETLVFLRILLAQGKGDEVSALLTQWLPAVEAAERKGSLFEMYALQVLALRLQGQNEMATRLLERILSMAEPEGYIRLFVDEGEPMRLALLDYQSFQDGIWNVKQNNAKTINGRRAYVDRLLSAFVVPATSVHESGVALLTRRGYPQSPIPKLAEPLTDRETEVLRLLTAGLSNAAIAKKLVITVGTVKSHLKHVYGKLDVQSRTQAVAQARALGLL